MNTLDEIIDRISYSLEYIEKNIFQTVSSIALARQAGYSLFHFQRVFKDTTGYTPQAYVRSRRLTIAAQELIETQNDIIIIAEDAGFESQAAFTKAFRKQYVLSPGRYRSRGSHQEDKDVKSIGYQQMRNCLLTCRTEIGPRQAQPRESLSIPPSSANSNVRFARAA